jgi:hypothetical protein
LHSDGAYQSEANRQLAADPEKGFKFVANGIQGKSSRYELNLTDDHNLEVTDKTHWRGDPSYSRRGGKSGR